MKVYCKKTCFSNNNDYSFKAGEYYDAEDITSTTVFHEKNDDHLYKKIWIHYKNGGSGTFYQTNITTPEFRYKVMCTGHGYFNDYFVNREERKLKLIKLNGIQQR